MPIITTLRILRAIWNSQRIRRSFERRGARVGSGTYFSGNCSGFGSTTIGDDCVISNCHLDGRGGLTIGNHCILDRAVVLTAQHDLNSPGYETTYHHTTIGDYVIIYRDATILPGRILGRGAVVAAGSVISRNIPEMAVVAGNPAQVLRYRAAVHENIVVSEAFGVSYSKLFRQISSALAGRAVHLSGASAHRPKPSRKQ